ncbi:MAG: ABC transporter ATP-binding protein [Peptococcaceae bacterium]|nr:ABC transporter ATP-binding protein [Peptococcaceae bacterium]
MAILTVEGLSKIYGSGETAVVAVDDVSFSVEKGEFVAIVGPSGCGKSTLMNLIGGVDVPTKGRVIIDGKDIYAMNESERAIFRRRNIGMVFQFYNLVPTLTAEENIMLPYLLDKRRPEQAKLAEILAMVGLTARAKHLPSALSGGQQQRVSVGRALINHPALILADEPTGNLDSQASRDVMALFALANQKFGQTLLLITHDEKIALMADRILTLGDGRVRADEVVKAVCKGGA